MTLGQRRRGAMLASAAARLVLFALLALFVTGCSGLQSSLDPKGPGAAAVVRLGWLFLCVSVFVEIAVVVFTLQAAFRQRRERDASRDPLAKDPIAERRAIRTVVVATGMTLVILFVLLVASISVGEELSAPFGREDLKIQIVGQMWWWEVTYDDPVPSNIVVTANEIHLPVGKRLRIDLASRDVIHSFWVPNLHGKKDLIPGHPTSLWLQADKPGIYRGQCAEFCGYQHANMAFYVIAEQEDEFYAWLARQRKPAAPPVSDRDKRGLEVFLQGPCVMCHAIQGTDAAATLGPNLTHLASRSTIAAGSLPNVPGHLAGFITDSQHSKPGNHMPPMLLSSEDLNALLAYLGSLQ